MRHSKTIKYVALAVVIAVLIGVLFYYTRYNKDSKSQHNTIRVISDAMQKRIHAGFAVGMAMAIVTEDDEYYILQGTIDIDDKQKITKDTLFEIGSVTKTFTGVLLSMMVLEDKISLDDPANKYMPTDAQLPSYNGTPILIKHLATHTSGLATIPHNMHITNPLTPYAGYTTEMFFTGLKTGEEVLLFEPGSAFNYSNTGIGLLGYILSEISGKTYAELLQEKLLDPLGMKDSYLDLNEQNKQNFAVPHTGENEVKHWRLESIFQATGGLISTAADMAKYVRANLSASDELIYAAMRESHKLLMSVNNAHIGTSWRLEKGDQAVAHAGGTGGSSSYIMIDLAEKKGVILLSNSSYSHSDLTYRALYDNAKLIDVFENHEKGYAGYYDLPIGLFDIVRIYVDEMDALRINIGFSDTRLNLIEEDKYYSRAINGSFQFERVKPDEYKLLYFDAHGQKIAEGKTLTVNNENIKAFLSVVK